MHARAIFNTLRDTGPQYLVNTYKWIKMAVWDAPYTIFLDVDLEYTRLRFAEMKEMSELENQEDGEVEDESEPGQVRWYKRTLSQLRKRENATTPIDA
uniref:Uncharacterized protein n=1 Tax=viral metagenome TaxID=1070528 RepID=A0A6C0CPB6_9ZZZZ